MLREDDFDEQWDRRYGTSRVVGMAKDPHTIFVYWEVDDTRRALIARHFCAQWDTLALYLCVYDVTDCWFDGYNAPLIARIRVQSEDNWYIHNLQSDRNYVIDLATTSLDDRLFSIHRSNVVTLPLDKTAALQPEVQFACTIPPPEISHVHPYASQFDGYHICE
ncbi:DUF4912 domain-containing protein [Alicyclobacillus fodiniaquatilis]|uniref:DUF4912 domain-containing protein n=1 Tax=Alicyclobacillus fodiniaquatilis TaxID=1661150 RepID=A0ABW4JPD2_9BACL